MNSLYTDAINSPPGRLAEILLKKMGKGDGTKELSGELLTRFDRLVDATGKPGELARIRLATAVSYLFDRAPEWTKSKIVPLFDWSSLNAAAAWQSRKYSNYIGSPELFGLTKKSFLEMFGRRDVSSEDLRIFAGWLAGILIANIARAGNKYPLTGSEARSALRRAGPESLAAVGHRLATEMERVKPEEKVERWRKVVGPVLDSIWPLDVDMQSNSANFKLVQILKSTGEAFSEAADVIIPLIRPDIPKQHSTIFSIANAPNELYELSPTKMLDLIAAVVGETSQGNVYALDQALSRIRMIQPSLADTRKFQRLLRYASR
jgi:hypothetical protein